MLKQNADRWRDIQWRGWRNRLTGGPTKPNPADRGKRGWNKPCPEQTAEWKMLNQKTFPHNLALIFKSFVNQVNAPCRCVHKHIPVHVTHSPQGPTYACVWVSCMFVTKNVRLWLISRHGQSSFLQFYIQNHALMWNQHTVLKGIVHRKLRWVKSGINRQLFLHWLGVDIFFIFKETPSCKFITTIFSI